MKNLLFLILLLLPLSNASALTQLVDLDPVSHWSCDEVSGVRYDSNLTTGNDLVDNNTVGSATGTRNLACDFESSNSEYLSISDVNQSGLEPVNITISLWAKAESFSGYGLLTKDTTAATGDFSYSVKYDPSNPYPFLGSYRIGASNRTVTTGTQISTSVWHHFVSSYDGTTIKTYIDGVATSTGAYSGSISYGSAPFLLGYFGYGGIYFDGLIDEITIFDSALSSSSVSAIYNGGVPLPYEAEVVPSESSTIVPLYTPLLIDRLTSMNCTYTTTSTVCIPQYASTTTPVTPDSILILIIIFLIAFSSAYWVVRKLT